MFHEGGIGDGSGDVDHLRKMVNILLRAVVEADAVPDELAEGSFHVSSCKMSIH